jgi:hypothetical protein
MTNQTLVVVIDLNAATDAQRILTEIDIQGLKEPLWGGIQELKENGTVIGTARIMEGENLRVRIVPDWRQQK